MHCDVVLLVVYIILRCHSSQTLTNLCCLAGSRSHSLASMANRFFKNGTTMRQNECRHLQSSSEEFTAAGLLTQAGVKYDNSTYIVFYASGDIGDQEIVHILRSIM